MTLKDEILKKYEDDNEYHLHKVDREWIMEAMQKYAEIYHINISKVKENELLHSVSCRTDWKKPLIDRCKYELRRYTELAKRMNKLMHEYNLDADYVGAKESEIKRNCYNMFVNDLKKLCS